MPVKYDIAKVTFQEVPEEVSLTISITGCNNNCRNCHSPHLRKDQGKILSEETLIKLIKKNPFITCVTFLGGDQKRKELESLLKTVKSFGLKTALYSGKNLNDISIDLNLLDYIKTGKYIEELGPLSSPNTNQKMYTRDGKDITFKFRKMA